jgi:hypothetical protein
MDDSSSFDALYLRRHNEGLQSLNVVHFPWHEVFKIFFGDYSDFQRRHLLLYFNVHDRVGAVDFLDWFLPHSSVRDCVSDAFASVTWAVRSGVLLKSFWELDYPVLTPSFYEILEYPALFNRVTQHTMVGAELAFVCLIYVYGSLVDGNHQFSFHDLLEYLSYFYLGKSTAYFPSFEGWHDG